VWDGINIAYRGIQPLILETSGKRRLLYEWADEWQLADSETVKVKGTPVVVFGSYDFTAPKPWLQLVANPKALDISEKEIEEQTKPFLSYS
jgi:hypothetical protein